MPIAKMLAMAVGHSLASDGMLGLVASAAFVKAFQLYTYED